MTKVYFSTSLFPAIGLRSVNQIFYALTVAQSISPKTGSSQTPGNQYQSTNCKVAKKSLSAGFNLLTIAQEIGDFIGMALCHHTVPGSHATAELYGLQRRFIPMQSHWYRDWTQFLLNRKLVKLSKKKYRSSEDNVPRSMLQNSRDKSKSRQRYQFPKRPRCNQFLFLRCYFLRFTTDSFPNDVEMGVMYIKA